MRGVNQVLSASLLALVLSGCDNSDTYVGGSGNGNSSPSANDLAQGNQLANAAAGGKNSGGAGVGQRWGGYLATDLESLQAALPTYMQTYSQTYVATRQNHYIDPALLAGTTCV